MSLATYGTDELLAELRRRFRVLSERQARQQDAELRADAQAILEQVASETGYSVHALRSRRRSAPMTRARWLAFQRLSRAGLSLKQVGQVMGRHYSTVFHGIRRLESEG